VKGFQAGNQGTKQIALSDLRSVAKTNKTNFNANVSLLLGVLLLLKS
jgi:hypothetical protein